MVSNVTGTDRTSVPSATFQICTSPIRAGLPPVTASFEPSGENRTRSMRSARPTSRLTGASGTVPFDTSNRSTSWNPDTANKVPSGEKSSDVITGCRE